MGTIVDKLMYLVDAVDDIKDAIGEKGVIVGNVGLAQYGNKIREIEGGGTKERFWDYRILTPISVVPAPTVADFSETTVIPVEHSYTSL